MSIFGIICETNPMHNGHKRLIDQARILGADGVVCIMSGNTVQRGEFAVADKYLRAKALLRCGADLVIELPFPWCSGSAESFALGGVFVAKRFCNTLIFGSECGDIDLLKKAAALASSDSFRERYSAKLKEGAQAASLYYEMLRGGVGDELSSNDLLGIEYIRASLKLGSCLDFKTVKRLGDGYMEKEISDDIYPSAMALRSMWSEGRLVETTQYIPEEAYALYAEAEKEGLLTDLDALDNVWLSFFRLHDGAELSCVAGAESGLANRLCAMSQRARTTEELLELVQTKRYTDAHLRRFMLYCLVGVTKDDLDASPVESLLLAANEKGREMLSKKRKEEGVRIVTKPADLDKNARQNILSARIDSIFSLAHKKKTEGDHYLKMRPYIE